ncbi:MAG: response regulator transcription factor [Gammaproteobacteria bacterium]|nr:response regulator transcription factor [Gammaproteobacteria bacterium]
MNKKLRILVVEDEESIRSGLIDVLLFHGYAVDAAADGDTGLTKSLSGQYDLLLLDVMLPGISGFDICNQVRQQDKHQAIIMLTAKNTDEDIVTGLTYGADDYIAKPFSVAQLVLRIQAVLRRSNAVSLADKMIKLDDDVSIDTDNLSGIRDGREIGFTRKEIELLQYLDAHSDRPVSRDELLNKVWGYSKDIDIETRTVDIHIAKIRRKLEPDHKTPQYLLTVRGAGYRLASR